MIRIFLPFIALAHLCSATGQYIGRDILSIFTFSSICQEIANSVSAASEVYDVVSSNYLEDISHWALSSSQFAACAFEPGTPEDVGIALQILGQTRTPFAVKGGGHSANLGFSSTEGVHIVMSRFSEVDYDSTTQTVTVGAGLVWDDVYAALEPHGVNVVGGRVSGIGVAGFTLGGGYSWLTNQYGLTVDTVQEYELVAPNGTVVTVTETSSPDLFFALKGGLNNFGIVTKFTFKVFPQTQVWGGVITYTSDVQDQVNQAVAEFSANNTDPKAMIIAVYSHIPIDPVTVLLMVFYDAPTPPAGVFDGFLAIPSLTKDVSTHSFLSLVKSFPAAPLARTTADTVSVTSCSLPFLESVVNEISHLKESLPLDVFLITYAIEPFLPTLFNHNTTPSAYPPSRTQGVFPIYINAGWLLPESDQVIQDAIRTSAQTLKASFGHMWVYPNYAMFDTPLVDMYDGNLPRLQAIKAVVDPWNVMGLAGGFKL